MKPFLFALLVFAIASAASAQEQQSPQVRALSQRVIAELQANIACTATAEGLSDQLKAAQAEAKRLSDKYEPKPEQKKD